jgi:hypothetical protein
MTFSVSRDRGAFEWAGDGPLALFCQIGNLLVTLCYHSSRRWVEDKGSGKEEQGGARRSKEEQGGARREEPGEEREIIGRTGSGVRRGSTRRRQRRER